ncbi:hypothetical protein A4H97_10995 [Niastella yeongjuensis]|uniref:Uncharacterized protein n=1 Tax=Niastella yeongjuensis TaxID=354355 RepID=A0A1V9EFI6_9BACT|nr:hypothetical protein A4H97_10995 [Niastella yeongjuensis]
MGISLTKSAAIVLFTCRDSDISVHLQRPNDMIKFRYGKACFSIAYNVNPFVFVVEINKDRAKYMLHEIKMQTMGKSTERFIIVY